MRFAYLAAHESSWKSPIRTRQWRQTLDDYVLPVIGKLPVAEVGPGDVKRVLSPLWKTKPEVARKTCGKIGMILYFAIAHEWRSVANPANLRIMRTVLGPLQQGPKHHPAMPWKDVPGFMRKIEKRKDVPALARQWLILTATRSSEARCATWQSATDSKLSKNLTLEVLTPLGIVAVLKIGYAVLNARHRVELAVNC
jgi:integrase